MCARAGILMCACAAGATSSSERCVVARASGRSNAAAVAPSSPVPHLLDELFLRRLHPHARASGCSNAGAFAPSSPTHCRLASKLSPPSCGPLRGVRRACPPHHRVNGLVLSRRAWSSLVVLSSGVVPSPFLPRRGVRCARSSRRLPFCPASRRVAHAVGAPLVARRSSLFAICGIGVAASLRVVVVVVVATVVVGSCCPSPQFIIALFIAQAKAAATSGRVVMAASHISVAMLSFASSCSSGMCIPRRRPPVPLSPCRTSRGRTVGR